MAVFSIFLGRLAGIPSDGLPYPIFVLAGLVPWGYFAHSLGIASGSLLNNQELVRRVYFPRLIIPLAGVLSCVTDLLTSLMLLLFGMVLFGIIPPAQIVLLPIFLLIAIASSLGAGMALAAANVKYRDVGYVVPFAIQILLFLTPVVYPSSLVPEGWRLVYSLNPMVGVIEGVRWCMLGATPSIEMILVSAVNAAVLLIGGLYYFRRVERTFPDLI